MNQIEILVFTSKTCVPCNRLKIKLQSLPPEIYSLIKFMGSDSENRYYCIMAFPTIIILRNGQQVLLNHQDRICGYRDDINNILEDIYEKIK